MENIVKFIHLVGKLKKVKRAGWLLKGIPEPESVADHSFRTAVLAYSLADNREVNREKVVILALLHDLAESIVGDITPHDRKKWEQKHELEKGAIEKIAAITKNHEIMDMWNEYYENQTPEAKLVHELDKLEVSFQALEYEKQHGMQLDEFWENVDTDIKSPKIRKIFEELVNQRKILT